MQKSCTELLKEFSSISVRESSGVCLLEKYFDVPKGKAIEVLDPTFLLDIDIYKKLISKYNLSENKFLFSYILDDDKDKRGVIDFVLNELGLEEVSQKAQTGDVSRLEPIEPVELWLSRLYNSSFVVTDSFHGMVFSILFNKPFIVYGNKSRGLTRFLSLLSKFGLENRLVSDVNNILQVMAGVIDWQYVNSVVDKLKNSSLKFLKDSL